MRWDIYFPQPKLAHFMTTLGNTDVWWYLNAEYGGGSWTVERPAAGEDRRMDINDIRVGGGFEWTAGQTGVRAYIEGAYVFNRELYYASSAPGTPQTQSLQDTFMVRGGFAY
jgi:hypothetical protein